MYLNVPIVTKCPDINQVLLIDRAQAKSGKLPSVL